MLFLALTIFSKVETVIPQMAVDILRRVLCLLLLNVIPVLVTMGTLAVLIRLRNAQAGNGNRIEVEVEVG